MDFKKYDIGEKSEKILKNYYKYWDGLSCIEGLETYVEELSEENKEKLTTNVEFYKSFIETLETLYKKEGKEVKKKILALKRASVKDSYKDLKVELKINEGQLQVILKVLRIKKKYLNKNSQLTNLSPLLFKEVETPWDTFFEYESYFEAVFRFISEELEVLKEVGNEVYNEFKKELK